MKLRWGKGRRKTYVWGTATTMDQLDQEYETLVESEMDDDECCTYFTADNWSVSRDDLGFVYLHLESEYGMATIIMPASERDRLRRELS